MKIDPEFRDLCPPLTPEELAALRESLADEGCRVPVDVWNGTVIDGHNRVAICDELGIPYETNTVNLPDRTAAILWIVRNQIGRRNLTPTARTRLALRGEDAVRERARAAQAHGATAPGKTLSQNSGEAFGRTDDAIGSVAHVSRDTVHRVRKLEQTARDEQADPRVRATAQDALARATSGDISLNEATKRVREQQEIATKPEGKVRDSGAFKWGQRALTEIERWCATLTKIRRAPQDYGLSHPRDLPAPMRDKLARSYDGLSQQAADLASWLRNEEDGNE